MFYLPNGGKIDIEGVIDAMEDTTGLCRYFLDTEKGDVGCVEKISGNGKEKAESLAKNGRYIEIPNIPEKEQKEWLIEFAQEFLKLGNKDERNLYSRIIRILSGKKENSFDLALKELEKDESGWIHGWAQWQRNCLWEKAEDWFGSLPIEIEDKFEGCDDCELCKLMGQGKHTAGDFNEAMTKEKLKSLQSGSDSSQFFSDFSDEDATDLYYNAMELIEGDRNDLREAEKILKKALDLDKNKTVQAHIGFVHLYSALKNKKKTNEHIKKAYNEAQIKFPSWPKRMEWGVLEYRPYMRAIQYRADLHLDEGEKDKAMELYRLLLKMNPNDNQGARYTIAGVYAGISGEEVNRMFDEGNEKQNWDKLEKMVAKQNAKHKFWKEPKS